MLLPSPRTQLLTATVVRLYTERMNHADYSGLTGAALADARHQAALLAWDDAVALHDNMPSHVADMYALASASTGSAP